VAVKLLNQGLSSYLYLILSQQLSKNNLTRTALDLVNESMYNLTYLYLDFVIIF